MSQMVEEEETADNYSVAANLCLVRGCFVTITPPQVFCSAHWDAIPFRIRLKLANAYCFNRWVQDDWCRAVADALSSLRTLEGL